MEGTRLGMHRADHQLGHRCGGIPGRGLLFPEITPPFSKKNVLDVLAQKPPFFSMPPIKQLVNELLDVIEFVMQQIV